MDKKQKIVVAGGIVGGLLGAAIGVVLSKRAATEGEPVIPPDGRKLIQVGTAILALVRLIQEL